jgi:hypothetical protein
MARRSRDDDYDDEDDRPRRRSGSGERRSSRRDDDSPPRPAKSARVAKPADDDGFEVVDDDPPRKAKSSRRAAEEDDDYDRPRSKAKTKSSRRFDEETAEDDRPKKKKSRLTKKDRERMRREDEDAKDDAQANAIMEWGPPIFLTFLGVFLMIVSGVILANRTEGLINPVTLIGTALVFTVILIPIIMLALMVIGSMMGIEYGTLKNAVRSLTAILMLSWGIFFLSRLFFIGWFLGPMISFIVTFGLFMVFFNLDSQEAMTTLGALNLLMWLADKVFWLVIIVALSRSANRDRDFDPDDGPQIQNKANQFDGGGGRGGGRRNRIDPDDDEFDN